MADPTRAKMSVTDRKELRLATAAHFDMLEGDIKRREQELIAEVQEGLLAYYRQRDADERASRKEVEELSEQFLKDWQTMRTKYREDVKRVTEDLERKYGDLDVVIEGDDLGNLKIKVTDPRRAEAERALKSKIPAIVADARTSLLRQRNALALEMSLSSLDSEDAKAFIAKLPTTGALVPAVVMHELISGTVEKKEE